MSSCGDDQNLRIMSYPFSLVLIVSRALGKRYYKNLLKMHYTLISAKDFLISSS